MSTFPRARIRIAADIHQFDSFADLLRVNSANPIPKLRAGDDAQFEIALFDNATLLTDLSGIESLQLEIKPLHAEPDPSFNLDQYDNIDLRGPATDISPIRAKTILANELNAALTLAEWDSQDPALAHAIIALDAGETNMAPGDRWLTLSVTTNDTPARRQTVAAGLIRIVGGGQSQAAPAELPGVQYFTSSQSDARYLRISENLADVNDPEQALANLGAGTAANYDAIDEDNFASQSSQHLPTQQSVKAYVDGAVAALSNPVINRPGVMFDGAAGWIELGNVFNQGMNANWAISGWLRTSAAAEQIIAGKGAAAPHWRISVTSGGLLQVRLDDGANSVTVSSPSGVNNGQWRHFAVSVDVDSASGLVVYIDGVAAASGDPTSIGDLSNADSLFLGSLGGAGFLNGALAELGFFNRSLSAADAARLRGHGLRSWAAESPASLEIALPLDEGVGLLSPSGHTHLLQRQSGYIRAHGVNAYNGGAGNVELVSSSRDIIEDNTVWTQIAVRNSGAGTITDLNFRASNRSNTIPLVQTTTPTGTTGMISLAPVNSVAQTTTRRNLNIHSTDVDATQLDVKAFFLKIK